MDLIALLELIYLVGLIVAPILIRVLPGLNKYLHGTINTRNPAVFSTILWPIVLIILSIYHTFKLIVAIINWTSGNDFITKSNKDYRPGGLC